MVQLSYLVSITTSVQEKCHILSVQVLLFNAINTLDFKQFCLNCRIWFNFRLKTNVSLNLVDFIFGQECLRVASLA